jgi:hypothetical protein
LLNKILQAIAAFAIFFFSYQIAGGWSWWHHNSFIHDDAAYFSFATTIGIDHDFDFSNEPSMSSYSEQKGMPRVGVGPGLMAAPFVGLFYNLDELQNHPFTQDRINKIRGSWSYFGFGLATAFYFMMGCWLYFRIACRLKINVNKLILILLCSGTGLMAYVGHRPSMTHAYEFFLFALLIFSVLNLMKSSNKKTEMAWAALGGWAVIWSWVTRPYALYAFLLPFIVALIWHIFYDPSLPKKVFIKKIFILLSGIILFLIAVFILNAHIYEFYFVSMDEYGVASYFPVGNTRLEWFWNVLLTVSSRLWYIWVILFGSSFPLTLFTPIIPFGLIMLLYCYFHFYQIKPWTMWALSLSSLAYISVPFMVVICFGIAGSAYGFRYLYGLIPLGMLGFFLWHKFIWTNKLAQKMIMALLVLTCVFATIAPIAYTTMPSTHYKESDINEFGFNEVNSPRENVHRTLRWLGHWKFYDTAAQISSYYVFSNIFRPQSLAHLHENVIPHAIIMNIFWGAGIFIFFFKVKNRER